MRSLALPLLLSWTVLAAACTSLVQPSSDFAPDDATQVFNEGFANIQEKYIQPLKISDFALEGMANLSEIDPEFDVARSDAGLLLNHNRLSVTELRVPKGEEPLAWAQLVTRVVIAGRRNSPSLGAAGAEAVYKAIFDGALRPLDRHSRYAGLRSARDYRAQREGFGGVGIRLGFDGEYPEIVGILADTPAERSRLRKGDLITHVDGVSLAGRGRRDVIWRLRGHAGAPVHLVVSREEWNASIAVTLKRSLIVSETVTYERRGNIALIRVSGFNQRTARNLERTIVGLPWDATPPLEGIVLDLRDNPGGLLDQAVAVADIFVGSGRIVSTKGRHPESFQVFNATGRDLSHGMPMVVLINGRSASAAEIVAAALQDQGRAVVVGSNSYGKGTVQNIARLPNDGELILTWSRFHAPSGYSLDDLGVLPNVCTSTMEDSHKTPLRDAMMREVSDMALTLATWRTVTEFHDKRRDKLRKRCPKTENGSGFDLEVARELLRDRRLYVRTLGIAGPVLAKGQINPVGTANYAH